MSNLYQQLDLLPGYLGHHIAISLASLFAGILLALPLSFLAVRVRWVRDLALGIAGVVQTIPGLAFLALMVPLLGQIGFFPAFVALVSYSVLPVLRNSVTGILGVSPSVREAARGIGMTQRQILVHVEIPLALPVIIAGIRTAAVWVIGTATLATPVGATSLGNFIFSGLQTRNFTAVLVGCVSAAGLALVFDQVIRLFEKTVSGRDRRSLVSASLALLVLIIVAIVPFLPSGPLSGSSVKQVVIGSKPFTEQYILASALERFLSQNGFETTVRSGLGSTILFDALASGEVDCYIDYGGTVWATNMQRTSFPARDQLLDEMTLWLRQTKGIISLGPLGFENTYALAMRAEEAESLNIRSISDLAAHASGMRLGSDYEFLSRPEWSRLRTAYDLRFLELKTMDPSLMYSAVRGGDVDVVSAYSTDGRVEAYDLAILKDDREILPPYDAVLLVSPEAAKDSHLLSVLRRCVGTVGNSRMRRANRMVDVDGLSVAAAADFLAEGFPDQ